MSYISSSDLVRCADGDAVAGFGTKVSLLLDDYDYAITCLLLTTTAPSSSMHTAHVPTLAGRFDRKTLTHSTMAAPELSMQLTRV